MRPSNTLLAVALCYTGRLVEAATAHIYIHDPQSQPKHETSSRRLDPVAARLVLAQRAGVEEYHASDLARPEVIDAINNYGRRTPLLEDDEVSASRAFILVEGLDGPPATLPALKSYTSFELDSLPADPASHILFADIARQRHPNRFPSISDDKLMNLLRERKTFHEKEDMFYIAEAMEDVEGLITDLADSNSWSITVIIMPKRDRTKSAQGKSQWGTYEMPGLQAPLVKRERPISEAPLSETIDAEPLQSFTAPVSALANNTEPFKGIIQACFTTQSACESATRNCTGHGSCRKKYHDSSAKQGDGVDCYSCSCSATKSSDGKKTTYWGGPACQKKDISIQFWLIVLFTVGMVFLIGFAVGTIWDMGSEELPSVIGAGVSGPTARK